MNHDYKTHNIRLRGDEADILGTDVIVPDEQVSELYERVENDLEVLRLSHDKLLETGRVAGARNILRQIDVHEDMLTSIRGIGRRIFPERFS